MKLVQVLAKYVGCLLAELLPKNTCNRSNLQIESIEIIFKSYFLIQIYNSISISYHIIFVYFFRTRMRSDVFLEIINRRPSNIM